MKFSETRVKGAYLVEPEPLRDERGYFARTYCEKDFSVQGLELHISQCNLSHNQRRGTLRGMHFQVAPHLEKKLVSCTKGSIYDVVLDLRKGSPSYGSWEACVLTATEGKMLFIPEGCAHGFQTLEDDTVVFYQIGGDFDPASARGVRWNDPRFGIRWPEERERILSAKDRSYPDYAE